MNRGGPFAGIRIVIGVGFVLESAFTSSALEVSSPARVLLARPICAHTTMNRRSFLHQTSALAAVSALPKLRAADAAQKKLKVAVVALKRPPGADWILISGAADAATSSAKAMTAMIFVPANL